MALARAAIGRFDIEAEAASGAAGTVYQAIDRGTGARVAVKVIRGLSAADTARFAREARILAQINHPGVVRYVGHGSTEEGNAYLAMEWLDGEDVRHRLVRTGLSIHESITLGLRVAEALVAVHAQGLVHRDIKPANIFLPGGLVADAKVIDFGLVHTAWASMEVTKTGMVVGTPSYMAPEQARGKRTIDARADVFSLGCVLYRCLTGRAPFEGKSVLAVLTKVLLEDAPPLRDLCPEVPPDLAELVMRMLRKDPDERPPSAAAAAAALAALAYGGDRGVAVEPAAPSHTLAGLTAGELRVAAVLLVGVTPTRSPAPASETTLLSGSAAGFEPEPGHDEGDPQTPGPSADLALRALVQQHGGQLDALLDGTRVVTLVDAGMATDEAARAARCALALRAALPGAPMAIATGRREVGAGQPSGNAIERAALLLEAARAPRAHPQPSGTMGAPLGAAPSSAPKPPGRIAVDEVTAALLDPRFEVALEADGERSLVGMRAVESGARTLLGRATPMVGREWELGAIRGMFRTVVEEREARSVLVTGAAGMGKSRLTHEAVAALRDDFPDVEVWWARGDPLRASSALGMLGQIVHSAAGVLEGDPIEARRRRLAERVAALVPAEHATAMAEALGEIAGVPFPDEASPTLQAARRDARLLHDQIRAAWEAMVAGACRGWPLLLVLEDLQWADAATMRLVGGALASLERRPWGVLALARPEVHETFPRLWGAHNLQELRLAPLTRRASERLVRQALGDAVGADTMERIAGHADGNAFYLEELIRATVERPALAPDAPPPSVRRGGGRAEGAPLPETVLGMVQARLEGLDSGTRRILRAASVFGEIFWAGGVKALLGGSEPHTGWVELLVQRELVVIRASSRFAGERDLAFRHALLCEGAYAMLTEGDRALGHGLAAVWLEQQGEPDAVVVAQHFEMARDERRAAHFYRLAAVQALHAANFDAAIDRAERALAQAEVQATRVECLSVLCEAHAWRYDWIRADRYAGEIMALGTPGSEPWLRAVIWKQSAAMNLGRADELRVAVDALMTVEAAPGTAVLLVQALMLTVFVLAVGARHREAAGILARMEVLVTAGDARELRLRGPLALELARVWVTAWGRGDAWAALRHARAARDGGEESHHARRQARFARTFVAMCQWSLGLYPEAEAELRALGPTDGDDDDQIAARQQLYLTLILLDRGALEEARALAQRRLETGRALGATREAEALWLLGEIAARSGDLDAAERDLARSLAPLAGSPLLWQAAAASLCEVHLARGHVAEAVSLEHQLHAAFVAAGGHGLRGAQILLVHAEVRGAAGERDAAHAALRAAWDDLQARADRIDDPAVRRHFLEDVRENARTVARAGEWLGLGRM